MQKSTTTTKNTAYSIEKMIEEVEDYAILTLDCDGIIQNWNKGARKIKGYDEHEAVGKHFSIFYLPNDRETQLPQSLLAEAREKGKASHEGWRLRKDGTAFWGSVVITAVHDQDNAVTGFGKVTRDLTERKLAEDQRDRDAKNIAHQNKQLAEFAHLTSHDLQEPIRKILTFISLCRRDIDQTDKLETHLAKIENSASRMSTLVRDILYLSKLSVEELQFSEVNLNEIVENVLEEFELVIAETNAVIEVSNLPTVIGIPTHLSQLFTNLIGNALKFCDKPPVISIKSNLQEDANEKGSSRIVVSLCDNGIGFDPKYTQHIFKPFKRLTHDFPGSGIGLAACQRIAAAHDAILDVTSELGKGTTFTIAFPTRVPLGTSIASGEVSN